MRAEQYSQSLGEATILGKDQHVGGIEEDHNELYELCYRYILLPPNVRFDTRIMRREVIVEIHKGMHKRVEQAETIVVTAGAIESHNQVAANDHYEMVIDVQK